MVLAAPLVSTSILEPLSEGLFAKAVLIFGMFPAASTAPSRALPAPVAALLAASATLPATLPAASATLPATPAAVFPALAAVLSISFLFAKVSGWPLLLRSAQPA